MINYCRVTLREFCTTESGATAIEYGLLAAILAVGLLTGINSIGGKITNMWNGIDNAVDGTS